MNHNIQELHSHELYKDITDDRIFTWRFFLNLTPEKRVLILTDKGYSLGLIISENVKEVILLDNHFNKNSITKAQKQANQNKNIKCVVSDFYTIPFSDNYFDTIIVGSQIKGLSSKREIAQFLKKIYRCLKSKGQIALLFRNPLKANTISFKEKSMKYFYLYKYPRFLKEAHFNNPQIILEGTGIFGEKFLFPKNDTNALQYYYLNFIGINNKVKRIFYKLLVCSRLYKLIIDKYLFIANKT